jgi:hypothetical protein
MHKGLKCLDIFTGRIYISYDVIFDESAFPFASLNSNARARYTSDVPLLPSSQPGDNGYTNMTNVTTIFVLPESSVQLQQGIPPVVPIADLVPVNLLHLAAPDPPTPMILVDICGHAAAASVPV